MPSTRDRTRSLRLRERGPRPRGYELTTPPLVLCLLSLFLAPTAAVAIERGEKASVAATGVTQQSTAARQSKQPTCFGLPATIVGTKKGETIHGTPSDDVIVARGGKDKVIAGNGDDLVCAGGGKDTVKGGPGRDWVVGGGGPDKLVGQADKDWLRGGGGKDRLRGGGDDDFLDGGRKKDQVNGGAGRDGCRGERRRKCESKRRIDRSAVDLDKPEWVGTTLRLSGVTDAAGGIGVAGGLLPATDVPDQVGRFETLVDLAPGTSKITVTSLSSGKSASVRVTRPDPPASGNLDGRIVDADSGTPIPGAEVEVDGTTTTAANDGTFELPVPADGIVLVQARKAGYLAGLAKAGVKDGYGTVGDVELVALAAGQEVGPDGGTLTGAGWKLVVPAGAVSEPTAIQVTPLPFTGAKDATWGVPLYDLSPAGLEFAKPVTLSVDSPLPDHADADVLVTGLDPETLQTRSHPARLSGGKITLTLSSFHGEETRVDPLQQDDDGWFANPANKWGGPEKKCKAFDSLTEARMADAWLRTTLTPFLASQMGAWNVILWTMYLDGGRTTIQRDLFAEPTNEFVEADFMDEPLTVRQTEVLGRIFKAEKKKGTHLESGQPKFHPIPLPGAPGDLLDLHKLDPGAHENKRDYLPGQVAVDYNRHYTGSGNAAGGTGSYFIGNTEYLDEREFSGKLRLDAELTPRGVVSSAKLVTEDWSYRVRDAVDLCPGDLGTGVEQHATIPLSRLEGTPVDGGGTWSDAVPFEIQTDLGSEFQGVEQNMGSLYRNDEDQDGWPDFQPMVNASYTLDNCPHDKNPDQADADEDGFGDACDDPECDDNDTRTICELAVFTSKWTGINAGGSFAGKGSTVRVRLAPTVPPCDAWPNRSNWSPAPCYRETDIFASGRCVYQDPETEEFKETSCASLYTEPPGWSTPPISEEADTFHYNKPGPVTRCGAAGNFQTYVWGGDARYEKWIKVGPTSLECRLTWDAEKPDALLGKTFMQIYGTLRGPETPDDGYGGFVARVSTWVPVKGKMVK